MSLVINSKYVYDSAGKIIEVILPVEQFQELHRRALAFSVETSKLATEAEGVRDELNAKEMTEIALLGGAFGWLKDEPDLYSDVDGEPL